MDQLQTLIDRFKIIRKILKDWNSVSAEVAFDPKDTTTCVIKGSDEKLPDGWKVIELDQDDDDRTLEDLARELLS